MDIGNDFSDLACGVAASIEGLTRPDHSDLVCPLRLPLPGVIILVHGVNSDGEWYDAAEQGLCAGLNARLARKDGQLAHGGIEAGQLEPVRYSAELDPDGFIDPNRSDKTFIDSAPNYSPVIRFRWGYKADQDEVKDWGDKVWLNEHDYWGGGPFANGCTTLADLWGSGLHDRLFLWITAQHLNPVAGRDAYGCPPRAYYVHAALRLARLIGSIRARQPDCPVTVVCHSQGNMLGMAAAFLGEPQGAVADSYVLANPPYSLEAFNGMDDWSQRYSRDAQGRSGRQSGEARSATLKAFFELIRARQTSQQSADTVDRVMANVCPQDGSACFTAASDRSRYGLGGYTWGRVTLYCNPHDQVISATTIRGIGWLGMSAEQIAATAGEGVFTQRVFAQGWPVGQCGDYDFWAHSAALNAKRIPPVTGFWHPPSPSASYSFCQGAASNQTVVGKFFTFVGGILAWPFFALIGARINADPPTEPKPWTIPIQAPALDPFEPQSLRYGQASDAFDEECDPAGAARNATKTELSPDDPYDAYPGTSNGEDPPRDAPRGNEQTEAQLRYEHRARLRMLARRKNRAEADGSVPGEDGPGSQKGEQTNTSANYRQWRTKRIGEFLKEEVDQSATDHSTTMTNPMHAERALAYDVAVGDCRLSEEDWRALRIEADWRYCDGLKAGHPHRYFSEYFSMGLMAEQRLHQWIECGEARRPDKIVDERSNPPSEPTEAMR